MEIRLSRSVDEPIREGLTLNERWNGPDQGLIWCWERGRQRRLEQPELADRADEGELVMLNWRGGVEEKLQMEKKPGALQYLAAWQGLRGEDLDIDIEGEHLIECTRTGQTVVFSAKRPDDAEIEA